MAEKLEDLNLPNAVVARIIKQAISENVHISKEARTALGRAASVFVLYVTSAATNVSKKANRKTVLGQDVLDAMTDLEFEEFVEPLTDQLEEFRKTKKENKSKQKKSLNGIEHKVGIEDGDEDMEVEAEIEVSDEEEEAT